MIFPKIRSRNFESDIESINQLSKESRNILTKTVRAYINKHSPPTVTIEELAAIDKEIFYLYIDGTGFILEFRSKRKELVLRREN